METEKWALIEASIQYAQTRFYISNFGNIKSVNIITGIQNPCTVFKNEKGYSEICRPPKKGIKKMKVHLHKEVGKHFVDGWFDGAVLNHKDRDKRNNHYTNLEWVTNIENSIHGVYELTGSAKGVDKVFHTPTAKISATSKPILCYNTDGDFVCQYESIRSTSKSLNLCPKRISDVLRGFKYDKKRKPIKSHKGYIFKYA